MKTKALLSVTALSLAVACGSPSSGRGAIDPAQVVIPGGETLYVLDPGRLDPETEVIALDPATGAVLARYEAGYDPAMVVSRDGSRLYITAASGASDPNGAILTVIDTASGDVVDSEEVPQRWLNTLPGYFPIMSLSPNDRWLHILQGEFVAPNEMQTSVVTYDTMTNNLMPVGTELPDCGAAFLLAGVADRRFSALCVDAHDARAHTVSENQGGPTESEEIELPIIGDGDSDLDVNGNPQLLWRVAGGADLPDREGVLAVTQNGNALDVDFASDEVEDSGISIPDDRSVAFGQVALSSAGDTLYLGTRSTALLKRIAGDQIAVVDPETFEVEKTLISPVPFRSFAVSDDGQRVYAISASTNSVVVFDVDQVEPVTVIPNVGKYPTLGEVATGGLLE